MFIWDFVLGDIMDQFIDWVYELTQMSPSTS